MEERGGSRQLPGAKGVNQWVGEEPAIKVDGVTVNQLTEIGQGVDR